MGWLAGIFAGLTFWYWFKSHGISFAKKPSRMGTFVATSFLEMFPFLPTWVIPGWTIAVAYLAISSRAKEALHHKEKTDKEEQSTYEEFDRAA